MIKKCTIVLAVSLASAAHAQLLSNSFENNSASQSMFNLTNAQVGATVSGVTAFGGANEVDLVTFPGFAGATPIRGNWMLGLSAHPGGSPVDGISMALALPIVAGEIYQFSMVGFQGSAGSPGEVQIGISTDPMQFGSPLASFTPNAAWGWTAFQANFVAQSSGGYLTIRVGGNTSYVLIDDVLLTPTPGAAALMGLGGVVALRRRR